MVEEIFPFFFFFCFFGEGSCCGERGQEEERKMTGGCDAAMGCSKENKKDVINRLGKRKGKGERKKERENFFFFFGNLKTITHF